MRHWASPLHQSAAIVLTVWILPARAAFEDMQIEQVIGGVGGNLTVQAIQLRMSSSNQNGLAPARIRVWDATGANPIVVRDFTAGVINHGPGVRVLIATGNLPSFTNPPLTPDFLMNAIPASYLTAGTLTYESDTGNIYWRLSWGGPAYLGPGFGDPFNDPNGNFNPAFSGPLPSCTTQAVQFRFSATANSTSNASDYVLTSGSAVLNKNSGAAATVTGPGPAIGACCLAGGACQATSSCGCAELSGAYQGNGSTCTPNPCPQPPDCNSNGIPDSQDIAQGTSLDTNANGIPDECESFGDGDFDRDCDGDLRDTAKFQTCFGTGVGAGCGAGDLNADGQVSLSDWPGMAAAIAGPQVTHCPPPDYWTTLAGAGLNLTFHQSSLPPGFFGAGCDGFNGIIDFQGVPFDSSTTGNADTRVQRFGDPVRPGDPPGTIGTVEVQLTALDLASIKPITVLCNGQPESWDLRASLSPTFPPSGTLTARKEHHNGGTFDSMIRVQTLFTFTNVGKPQQTIVWDTHGAYPPLLFGSTNVPFVHAVNPNLGVFVPPGAQFVPGVTELVPGDPNSQAAQTVAKDGQLDQGRTLLGRHTFEPVEEKVCIYEVVCRAAACSAGGPVQCPLMGYLCRDAPCPGGFCDETFTAKCGDDPNCCVSYKLVECRFAEGELECPRGPDCPTGACCLSDNTCIETTADCCAEQEGVFQGVGTDCEPEGACCLPGGACVVTSEECCMKAMGAFQGADSECEPTGACCFDDGSCRTGLTEECCEEEGGSFQGADSDCDPKGACCLNDGSCIRTTEECCDEAFGDYQGDDSQCQPTGACCFNDGTCEQTPRECCTFAGGDYQGDDTDCGLPGSCCFPSGACLDFTYEPCCERIGGTFHVLDNCSVTGACCNPSNGTCSETSEACCQDVLGIYQGDGTACDPGIGACCYPGQVREGPVIYYCEETTENCCGRFNGSIYLGDGTFCTPDPCPVGACCLSDGTCEHVKQQECFGDYLGDGVSCGPVGACCFDDGSCAVRSLSCCANEGGSHLGVNTDCDPHPCCTVDLDIDSDNNGTSNGYFAPDHSAAEDGIEDDPAKPGRYLPVNDDDDDHDGVPDFLDGYNAGPGAADDRNEAENDFIKFVVEIPEPVDLSLARVRVTSSGDFRIWIKNGDVERDIAPISAGGDRVANGTYSPAQLGVGVLRTAELWLEGLNWSVANGADRIQFEVDPDGEGLLGFLPRCVDAVRLTVVKLDLDVDSDNTNTNTNGDFGPLRDLAEDNIEDKNDTPGKYLCVNKEDDDRDEIADYGDGFGAGANPNDDANGAENDFVRMVLQVSAPIDLSVAKVRVTYNASDPAGTTVVGTPPVVTPAAGRLRIWTRRGNLVRKKEPIDAMPTPGHYVGSDEYDASDFSFDAERKVDLWLEGIRPSPSKGGDRIVFEVDPDGDDPAGFVHADAVRVTDMGVTVSHLSGLDAQNRVFTTLNVAQARGEAGPVALKAEVMPADALPAGTKIRWRAIDVDDAAGHIHLDPNDHDADDNDGDGTVDNNDGVDNSGILTAAHMFTLRPGFAISDEAEISVMKNVDGDADINDGAERPVANYTSVTGTARTVLDANGVTEVVFNATNDGGDNFRVRARLDMPEARSEDRFPREAPPITVWRRMTAVVYAMNNPAGGVYYPLGAGAAAANRFDNFINAYGDGASMANRAAFINFSIADSTTRASLGSNFTRAAPYALANNDQMSITVDGGAAQAVTFQNAGFANIAQATAAEVAAVINTQVTGVAAAAITLSNGNVKLVIRSNSAAAASALLLADGAGTPGADLGLPLNETVTRTNTTYFADILDDINAIQFEEYFQLHTDYHGSNATNPPNPDDMIQILGVRRQEGFLGATDRQPHSLVDVPGHGGNAANLDQTAIHEPGHSFLDLGNADFHNTHTATPAVIRCAFENPQADVFICPRHLRMLRNSIFRNWAGADTRQTRD